MAEQLIGIIGGSGLGDALIERIEKAELHDVDTPFGKPSDKIITGRIGSRKIAFINRHGEGHTIMPSGVPYAANVFALKSLGVHTLLATGAVGSLQEQIAPGHLVIVDQFIDKTINRQSTFFADYGAVHCELAEPICPRLSKTLIEIAESTNIETHSKGTYVCMEGPQFSTRAESLMHRQWGSDLIGMTAMPEAKLAREAQMCYSLIALPSDYDCWRQHDAAKDKQTLLQEIIGNLQKASQACLTLIEAVLTADTTLGNEECPCRKSLELAVWTNPDCIDAERKGELAVLFA